jgi:hypothetical protein
LTVRRPKTCPSPDPFRRGLHGAADYGSAEPGRLLASAKIAVHPSRDPDRIRGEEGTELGIEVSGMEVYASVFGVRARETRIARIVRQDDRATFS